MELNNEFRVAIPVEQAWTVLTDLERIAPCMPGAQLTEVEGDIYRGTVKVKVGPAQAQYKGEVTFVERDDDAHVAVLRAEGRETRGQGKASATITARLTPDEGGTAVSIDTDLSIAGRVAQFGRSALVDVSTSLLDQFVECLESSVLAEGGDDTTTDASETSEPASEIETETGTDQGPADTTSSAPESSAPSTNGSTDAATVRRIDSPDAAPIDLMATAGTPVLKQVLPALIGLIVLVLIVRWIRGCGGDPGGA